jgi:lathosterol oxidase
MVLTALLLHILGYDIWFYISHLLLHTPALWRFHKIHHEIMYPRFTDTYKGHMLEGPFQSLGFAAPLLLGTGTDAWSFIAALIFVNVRGMARHDDRTVWLIGNHHLLHHQYLKYNFGEYWLDALFGTSIPERSKVKKGACYV